MLRATLRSLAAHKLRLVLSGLAVVLGVAFVAGTFVFTDTLHRVFDDLITATTADVVVTAHQQFEDTTGYAPPGSIPASALQTVTRVDGVAKAAGVVLVNGVTIIGSGGQPIGLAGAPAFGANWSPDPDLAPFRLTTGRAPSRPGEVAVDQQSATSGRLVVGQTITVVTNGPRLQQQLVGVFRYGTSGNLAGASVVTFTEAEAQRLLLSPGHFTEVDAKAQPGVSQQRLAARIATALGAGYTVKTGQDVADTAAEQVTKGLSFISIFLLVFALVALFVGSFLILNTFSMLVAQRTRELGLLRAMGATRRQVTASVLGEAGIVGLLGGLVGLLLGVAIAVGLKALLGQVGFSMPTGALIVRPRTVLLALGLGVGVTLLAAYLPARRASRIPPVAALRADATPPLRSLRRRITLGVPLVGLGVVILAVSWPASGSHAASLVGVAALLTLVGVIICAPALSRPAVSVLGAAFGRSVTGRIAVRNAGRNPRRTAVTATALMIGLALVTTFSIMGSSAKASTSAVIDRVIRTDFIVTPRTLLPFSSDVARRISQVPGVAVVSPVRTAPALIAGSQVAISGVDPATILRVADIPVIAGSIADVTTDTLLVDDRLAADYRYRVGQLVAVTFQSGQRQLPVVAIYQRSTGFNGYVVSNSTLQAAGLPDTDTVLYVSVAPGVAPGQVRPDLDRAVAAYPNVRLADRTQFKAQLNAQINQLLALIYGLLGLAILIAVLGIVNTLSLSIVERTREIGMLRALGATRTQLRGTIRREAVLIAVFGTLLGLALGLTFGVALQHALATEGINILRVPWWTLLAFVVVASGVGVLAAAWPARRAARLNVLTAITTE